jgi:thioredoxin 1
MRIVVGIVFVALVAGAVAPKPGWCATEPNKNTPPVASATTAAITAPVAVAKLPKLLDLGATRCIPCKMMAPILEQLKQEHAGRLEVEFIDVWQNPNAAKQYKIEMIPTQIFYGNTGKELFRHVGFIGRDDILAKWKELGVNLSRQPIPADSAKPPGASSQDKTKRD